MCHKKIKRPADLSIEEGTLSAALFRVKQRCGKVDDFLHFLSFAKKTLAEFHHVNPIVVTPLRLVALGSASPRWKFIQPSGTLT